MFSRQAPQINHSLWQGGLSAAQASVVMNALGQCRAPLVHRAPVTVDYTSPDMRLIDASTTNIKYPDIIILPPEVPPPRPRPPTPPEETPTPEPNPLPPKDPIAPVQPPAGAPGGPGPGGGGSGGDSWQQAYNQLLAELGKLRQEFQDYQAKYPDHTGGDYIDVDSSTSRTISLKTSNNGQGLICKFGTDEIVGESIEDILFNYALMNNDSAKVVTDVTFDGTNIVIEYGRLAVWRDEGADGTSNIPTVQCPNP